MLRRLEIRSFKSYEGDVVHLEPFTVMVGPNGSGKTSVLQAIEFLGGVVRGTLGEQLERRSWAYRDLPRMLARDQQFEFDATVELERGTVEWDLRFGTRRRSGIAAELVSLVGSREVLLERDGRTMWRLDRKTGERESVKQTLTSSWLSTVEEDDADRYPELLDLATWARGIQPYITLDPTVLRGASRRTSDGIGARGESLAGFLRFVRDRDPARFAELVARVKRHYQHLEGVTIRQATAGWNRIEIEERWGRESVQFTANQVSDGLLRLIAIAALEEVPDPPSVLMIDEIENGLHPHMVGGLISMLEDLANRGRTQVIVTTHNPIALNYVSDPSGVLVVTRSQAGKSQVTPLSETAGYESLGRHLDAGELWYNLGETGLLRKSK